MRISDWSSDVCSSDLQAIEAWYQANLATLPDPDTIAQSPIGSNDPTVNNGFNTPTPTPDDPVLLTNSAYKMVAIDDQSVQQNDAFSQTSQQLQQTTTGSNRSEEHTSALQSLMRISYAVFCLQKKTTHIVNST